MKILCMLYINICNLDYANKVKGGYLDSATPNNYDS